ncbi:Squalene/phytoene synthase [Roseovarius sp. THAF27]|uniref:squalene/phytoene synthase family protein n=1 Tax=unclassified Roseovarius TaxID=2614913 RepID=UPI00126831D0|nr:MULTISPECIES: squalene/phytoene synthase family protein [unclassified Roseovarius]QFT80585.1 Squalene/phytoene synthase [Roseovarius sp. THAF27]QFT96288.1 Squalene/phytoene synthase [Roseovarius sp. THAF8]
MALDPDIMACAGLVHRGDPERFAATMAAPVPAREKLFPLYAFNVEVSRAPWVTQESMIAEMRLQWWRDVLEEIRTGAEVRRHEVATPLARVLDTDMAARLDALVEARRWDIYRDPFEDMSAFRGHLTNTSGLLLLAAARTLGDAPEEPILKAGYAQGVANWLRAVPELERQGRIPLVEGTHAAIRALADDALTDLAEARRTRPAPEVRPAMLALWQTDAILKKARRDPAAVSENRLTLPPFRSRLGLMHRALTGRW